LAPTVIVDTGNGLQPWWLLLEPVEAMEADEVVRRFGVTWVELGKRHGWQLDNVGRIERVFRLPGTINTKTSPGRAVRIVEARWERRYGLDDLDAHTLEPTTPPRPPRPPRATQAGIPLDDRPSVWYKQNHPIADVLLAAGCGYAFTSRTTGRATYYAPHRAETREQIGVEVYDDPECERAVIWSRTWAAKLGVEPQASLNAFRLFALTKHGGDFTAAARAALAERDALRPGAEYSPPGEDGPPIAGRFKSWGVKELLAADLSYRWDVRGMLIRGTYGVDTGELKTLKSYLALARMIGLAAGRPVLGHWVVPERRRVLCYVAEGGRIGFTRRLIRMCAAYGIDPDDLDGWLEIVFEAGPLDSAPFRDALTGKLAEFGPAFVQLDPLYSFQPMTVDSNKVSQVGLMLSEIQAMCARHDATFWITAHMNQTGAGFDLKRISGAGVGEWGDSWCLLRHRQPPDVGRGRFYIEADVGSRQWGGGSFRIDWNIGHFDTETNTHDGPITFTVGTRNDGDESPSTPDDDKRLAARRAIFKTMRGARAPLTMTEIIDRSVGVAKDYRRAGVLLLIDDGGLIETGTRTPDHGGKPAPLYRLADDWGGDE
jgi:hypothetical protein